MINSIVRRRNGDTALCGRDDLTIEVGERVLEVGCG
jgi:hypothetical protein